MDAWMVGKYKMLVQDTEMRTLELLLDKKQGIATPEQRASGPFTKRSSKETFGAQ
jgi:hypothetical protein